MRPLLLLPEDLHPATTPRSVDVQETPTVSGNVSVSDKIKHAILRAKEEETMPMNRQLRGDVLKAVATLLSNLSGPISSPVVRPEDILTLRQAWEECNGIVALAEHLPTCSRINGFMDLPAYVMVATGQCIECGARVVAPRAVRAA